MADTKDFPIGAQVIWHTKSGMTMKVTIRENGNGTRWAGHYYVDDGDPKNPDLKTNGFHIAAWVEAENLSLLKR